MSRIHIAKLSAAALVVSCLAAAPGFANNGNGNSGGSHGSSSSDDASQIRNMIKVEAKIQNRVQAQEQIQTAEAYGALNGFLNASPMALANADAESEVGLVSVGYADMLRLYLAGTDDAPTALQLKTALAEAYKQPLSTDVVVAVNDKLAQTFPDMTDLIASHDGGSDGLAQTIVATE